MNSDKILLSPGTDLFLTGIMIFEPLRRKNFEWEKTTDLGGLYLSYLGNIVWNWEKKDTNRLSNLLLHSLPTAVRS